jgi:hypothetical protein
VKLKIDKCQFLVNTILLLLYSPNDLIMRLKLLALLVCLSGITLVNAQAPLDSNSVPLIVRRGFNEEHSDFSKKTEWFVLKHPHDEPEYIAFFDETGGWSGRVFVDSHGHLSDVVAKHIDSVPKAVQAKFNAQHFGVKVVQWSNEYYYPPYKYSVDFFNNMHEYIVKYDSAARISNTMILVPNDSLPTTSQAYLKKQYSNFLNKETWPLRINMDSASIKTYQVGIRKDKLNYYRVIFNSSGEYIKSEVVKLQDGE